MKPRDRRALLIGASVISVSWLLLSGIPEGLRSLATTEDRLAQRIDLLQRSRRSIQELGVLDDSIARLEGMAATLSARLLVGSDAHTASVDLMRRTSDRLRGVAGDVSFGGYSVAATSESLQLVSLESHFETDFAGLLALVDSLERDEALGIETIAVEARRSEADASGIDVERLSVTITVSGWFPNAEAAGEHSPMAGDS